MNYQVFFRIADFPLPGVFSLELNAHHNYANLILGIPDATNWKDISPSLRWDVVFEDTSLKNDNEAFTAALAIQTRENPILVYVHPEHIVATHVNGGNVAGRTVQRQRRQLKKTITVDGNTARTIDYNTPYNDNVMFGEYVPLRDGSPMDRQIIDLKNFPEHYRTEFGARLIAYLYAVLFYDGAPIGVDDDMQHALHSYGLGNSFSSLITRPTVENVVNPIVALTQQGKGKEIVICAVMNIFLGKDSIVFMRDISGNAAKTDFKNNVEKLSRLFVGYCNEVLGLEIDYYENLLATVKIYEGKGCNFDNIQRPFIYCERLNPSKIKYARDKIYRQGGLMMYSLFIDEEDEKRMSRNATVGKCENILYNIQDDYNGRLQDDIDGSVYTNAFMAVAFTATPAPILTSKPISNREDFRYNIIELPIPDNYKGYDKGLPEERRIVTIETPPKNKADRNATVVEKVKQSDAGIDMMITHMKECYMLEEFPHVSGLISCSSIRVNIPKAEFAKGLVMENGEFPIIAFADCQDTQITLYAKTEDYFPSVSEHRLQHEINRAFDGTQVDYEEKKINIRCSVHAEGFTITIDRKEDKTVRIIYDIALMIYRLEATPLKPFLLCTTFALGNRGSTYKPTNHSTPLSHMYASEKTVNFTYAGDVKQIGGRLCSVDNYGFRRYLFAPREFLAYLETANRIDMDLLRIFRGQPKTFDEAFADIDPDCEIGRLVHYTGRKIMKRKLNEDVVPDLSDKIRRLDEREYTTAQYGGIDDIDIRAENEVPDVVNVNNTESHTDKVLRNFFIRHGNEGFHEDEIAQLLIDNGYVQVYEQGEARPEVISENHFRYQRRQGEPLDVHDFVAIRDRIRRALLGKENVLYKQLPHTGMEGNNGRLWDLVVADFA